MTDRIVCSLTPSKTERSAEDKPVAGPAVVEGCVAGAGAVLVLAAGCPLEQLKHPNATRARSGYRGVMDWR
ncbi:MAG TPA: hypothetical protein VJ672_04160 [Gemmatimonadaceae bacterium]|nr:hypothetical protein [Gemmatimonadaceae bacterium]